MAMGAVSSSQPEYPGRYHLTAVGDDNAYLVDSFTGSVWRNRTHSNDFVEMNRIDSKKND